MVTRQAIVLVANRRSSTDFGRLDIDWRDWAADDSRLVVEDDSVVGVVWSEPGSRRGSYVEKMGGRASKLDRPK